MSKDFFNARAATWDEKAAEQDTGKLKAMAARLDIKPGSAVLDVGTGTGIFVPYIMRKIGSAGNLLCLDYAEEMLKATRAKGFEGNIGYLCTGIEDSQLPDSLFDAVVCYSVFPHFEDKPKALKEINRLLKKDGVLYICHTSCRRAINDIHRSLPEICDHLFPENGDLHNMLVEAGFGDISINDGENDYLASARKAA